MDEFQHTPFQCKLYELGLSLRRNKKAIFTSQELDEKFKYHYGCPIPYGEFGFRSLDDLLEQSPFFVRSMRNCRACLLSEGYKHKYWIPRNRHEGKIEVDLTGERSPSPPRDEGASEEQTAEHVEEAMDLAEIDGIAAPLTSDVVFLTEFVRGDMDVKPFTKFPSETQVSVETPEDVENGGSGGDLGQEENGSLTQKEPYQEVHFDTIIFALTSALYRLGDGLSLADVFTGQIDRCRSITQLLKDFHVDFMEFMEIAMENFIVTEDCGDFFVAMTEKQRAEDFMVDWDGDEEQVVEQETISVVSVEESAQGLQQFQELQRTSEGRDGVATIIHDKDVQCGHHLKDVQKNISDEGEKRTPDDVVVTSKSSTEKRAMAARIVADISVRLVKHGGNAPFAQLLRELISEGKLTTDELEECKRFIGDQMKGLFDEDRSEDGQLLLRVKEQVGSELNVQMKFNAPKVTSGLAKGPDVTENELTEERLVAAVEPTSQDLEQIEELHRTSGGGGVVATIGQDNEAPCGHHLKDVQKNISDEGEKRTPDDVVVTSKSSTEKRAMAARIVADISVRLVKHGGNAPFAQLLRELISEGKLTTDELEECKRFIGDQMKGLFHKDRSEDGQLLLRVKEEVGSELNVQMKFNSPKVTSVLAKGPDVTENELTEERLVATVEPTSQDLEQIEELQRTSGDGGVVATISQDKDAQCGHHLKDVQKNISDEAETRTLDDVVVTSKSSAEKVVAVKENAGALELIGEVQRSSEGRDVVHDMVAAVEPTSQDLEQIEELHRTSGGGGVVATISQDKDAQCGHHLKDVQKNISDEGQKRKAADVVVNASWRMIPVDKINVPKVASGVTKAPDVTGNELTEEQRLQERPEHIDIDGPKRPSESEPLGYSTLPPYLHHVIHDPSAPTPVSNRRLPKEKQRQEPLTRTDILGCSRFQMPPPGTPAPPPPQLVIPVLSTVRAPDDVAPVLVSAYQEPTTELEKFLEDTMIIIDSDFQDRATLTELDGQFDLYFQTSFQQRFFELVGSNDYRKITELTEGAVLVEDRDGPQDLMFTLDKQVAERNYEEKKKKQKAALASSYSTTPPPMTENPTLEVTTPVVQAQIEPEPIVQTPSTSRIQPSTPKKRSSRKNVVPEEIHSESFFMPPPHLPTVYSTPFLKKSIKRTSKVLAPLEQAVIETAPVLLGPMTPQIHAEPSTSKEIPTREASPLQRFASIQTPQQRRPPRIEIRGLSCPGREKPTLRGMADKVIDILKPMRGWTSEDVLSEAYNKTHRGSDFQAEMKFLVPSGHIMGALRTISKGKIGFANKCGKVYYRLEADSDTSGDDDHPAAPLIHLRPKDVVSRVLRCFDSEHKLLDVVGLEQQWRKEYADEFQRIAAFFFGERDLWMRGLVDASEDRLLLTTMIDGKVLISINRAVVKTDEELRKEQLEKERLEEEKLAMRREQSLRDLERNRRLVEMPSPSHHHHHHHHSHSKKKRRRSSSRERSRSQERRRRHEERDEVDRRRSRSPEKKRGREVHEGTVDLLSDNEVIVTGP